MKDLLIDPFAQTVSVIDFAPHAMLTDITTRLEFIGPPDLVEVPFGGFGGWHALIVEENAEARDPDTAAYFSLLISEGDGVRQSDNAPIHMLGVMFVPGRALLSRVDPVTREPADHNISAAELSRFVLWHSNEDGRRMLAATLRMRDLQMEAMTAAGVPAKRIGPTVESVLAVGQEPPPNTVEECGAYMAGILDAARAKKALEHGAASGMMQ